MGYSDRIKDLRTDVQKMQNEAKTLHADLETRVKGLDAQTGEKRAEAERSISADQTKLDNLLTDGRTKRAELDRLIVLEDNEQFLNQPANEPKARERGRAVPQHKSWGQLVIDSPEFKNAPATSAQPRMDRVNVKASLYATSDSAGGYLVQVQRLPEMVELPQRPPSFLNLINQSETTSDSVEYTKHSTRTNNAAPTPEYTGGNFALKPESGLAFTLETTAVKTIPTWIPVSRRILQDAPRLRNMVDNELTYMLREELEDQVINGDGVGENFTGILNTSGILTRTQGSGSRALAGDTVADTLRRAITDVVLQFYQPNAIVLNPVQLESIELSKDDNDQYIKIMDPATGRLWRVAVTETPAMPSGKGVVGDLMLAATIWDRMQTEIRVGEPNDFFLRNALALLAELRAAFAVTRPLAINKVTFS